MSEAPPWSLEAPRGAKAELASKHHWRRLEAGRRRLGRRLGRRLERDIRRLEWMKFDQVSFDPRGRPGSMEVP